MHPSTGRVGCQCAPSAKQSWKSASAKNKKRPATAYVCIHPRSAVRRENSSRAGESAHREMYGIGLVPTLVHRDHVVLLHRPRKSNNRASISGLKMQWVVLLQKRRRRLTSNTIRYFMKGLRNRASARLFPRPPPLRACLETRLEGHVMICHEIKTS